MKEEFNNALKTPKHLKDLASDRPLIQSMTVNMKPMKLADVDDLDQKNHSFSSKTDSLKFNEGEEGYIPRKSSHSFKSRRKSKFTKMELNKPEIVIESPKNSKKKSPDVSDKIKGRDQT
jgi:hypothetical protein